MIDAAYWRDISIIVVSTLLSVFLIVFAAMSLLLYRKTARALDTAQDSLEKVAGITTFIEENLKGIAGIAGLILGLKQVFEALFHRSEKPSEERGG